MKLARQMTPDRRLGRNLPGSPLWRNPFTDMDREFERVLSWAFSDFLGGDDASPAAYWDHPEVNLYEDKENFFLRIALPGLKREDIHLEMGEGVLIVSGERKAFDSEGKEENTFRFKRSISVPVQVEAENVSASYEKGILTVTLPKREEIKPKKVAIEVK